jgi:hypothetical protein
MKEPYRKGDSESILASSLAGDIVRYRLKRPDKSYRNVARSPGVNLLLRFSLNSLRGQDSWRRRNICEWSLFKFDANQPVGDRINILN